jgi:hypothetical protein
MMALTASMSDSYVLRDVYELPDDVPVEKFTASWDAVMRENPILRTRLVFIHGLGTCQVVVDEQIPWQYGDNLDDYLSSDRDDPMDYGTSLARFAIIEDGKRRVFAWTVHHALYDGYSMDMTLGAVDHAYKNNHSVLPTRPFAEFMAYLDGIDRETLTQFWTQQLSGLETSHFPQSPAGHRGQADNTVSHLVPFSLDRTSGITMATLLKASWAILVSRLSESHDVVYGVTQSGRDLELFGIDGINGPTITTVSSPPAASVVNRGFLLTRRAPGPPKDSSGRPELGPGVSQATAGASPRHDSILARRAPKHQEHGRFRNPSGLQFPKSARHPAC